MVITPTKLSRNLDSDLASALRKPGARLAFRQPTGWAEVVDGRGRRFAFVEVDADVAATGGLPNSVDGIRADGDLLSSVALKVELGHRRVAAPLGIATPLGVDIAWMRDTNAELYYIWRQRAVSPRST